MTPSLKLVKRPVRSPTTHCDGCYYATSGVAEECPTDPASKDPKVRSRLQCVNRANEMGLDKKVETLIWRAES